MRALLVLAALAVPLLAGCGTSGREADVRAVAERFSAAIDARDGAAACALLTAPAREQLESDERQPCRRAVFRLGVPTEPIAEVSVAITSASATYNGGGALFLDETTHGWRIASAACTPKPDDAPYDCELSP